MTLNLMATSRNAVYLSGDFRLTREDTGAFTDNLDTQKLIPVIRLGWGALIAVTGIASFPPHIRDTVSWVLAKVNTIPMDGSFGSLPNALLEANAWLRKIPREVPLAFSIVGFVGQRPFMMAISNFSDLNGHMGRPSRQLRLFQHRPKHIEVRVAGDIDAIRSEEKEDLKRLLQQKADRQLIRENLAELNVRASQRSRLISPECVTGYLLSSGLAEIGPHGIQDDEEYLPGFVISDFVKNGVAGFSIKYDETERDYLRDGSG